MKYCVHCGNPIEDSAVFCPKCGTRSILTNSANGCFPQDKYSEYWGLTYRSTANGIIIELTPNGVHIFNLHGNKRFQINKVIPYAEILDIIAQRASAIQNGYLSIVTVTEGITTKATRQQLLSDHNTIVFNKKTEPLAEHLYQVLKDICANPPPSNNMMTYYENDNLDSSLPVPPPRSKQSQKYIGCLIPILFLLVMSVIFAVTSSGSDDGDNSNISSSSQNSVTENSPEDYEGAVFDAFWEGASKSFGVGFNDYKWTHTVTSYISDSKTSDGYTAHYYLVKTAFETTNISGQEILHEVTARCYYVPEYSSTIYLTYLTLDGETVYFDEEKENWLMDMG